MNLDLKTARTIAAKLGKSVALNNRLRDNLVPLEHRTTTALVFAIAGKNRVAIPKAQQEIETFIPEGTGS
jgi:hypothetical protein